MPDYSAFSSLLAAGADVLLVGGPSSGKRTMLSACGVTNSFVVNCALFKTVQSVQRDLLFHLTESYFPDQRSSPPRTFAAMIELVEFACDSLPDICVVFRDCEQFFAKATREFHTFFQRHDSFMDALHARGLRVQTVVMSKKDLPLPYLKCRLPYPTTTAVKARLSRFFEDKLSRRDDASVLRPIITRLVGRCAAFGIVFGTFDAFQQVAAKLLHACALDFVNGCEDPLRADSNSIFLRCESLLYRYPRLAFESKRRLLTLMGSEKVSSPVTPPFGLSPICGCLLLAMHACTRIRPSRDLAVMGEMKSGYNGRGGLLNDRPMRSVRLWRVLSMAQLVMKMASEHTGLEFRRLFHSNEFFSCLNFLVEAGLVEAFGRTRFDKGFRLRCEGVVITAVAQSLGFKDEIGIWAHA